MTLHRNPDNFFAETEQVAFCPSHIVPGIDFSNDPLLQGRLFSYLDTQLTRLGGPNFAELPINRPTVAVHNLQRDGFMRHGINQSRAAYAPNSLGGGCPFQAGANIGGFASYPERVEGQKVRERSNSFRDHFSQATLFWKSQSEAEQEHIVAALQFELGMVETLHVRERMVDLLTQVDADLAARVAPAIGVVRPPAGFDPEAAMARLEEGWERFGVTSRPGPRRDGAVQNAPELSMAHTIKNSVKGRKVAVLAADGVNRTELSRVKKALNSAGAQAHLVSRNLGSIKSADGQDLAVDKTFATTASVMYDAVFVPGGAQSVETLAGLGDAIHFVNEAFKHCKAIAATSEGLRLLQASDVRMALAGSSDGAADGAPHGPAVQSSDAGVIIGHKTADAGAVAGQLITAMTQHRHFARLNKELIPA
jgi:catalase